VVSTFVLVVCLQAMTGACVARTPAAGLPNPPQASREDARADECALIAGPGEPVATLGLSEPIDPSNAPSPSNDSERLLFRQLFETLVRVDCMGRVAPGLAASWHLDADGRTWIVTLREDARFSDGTPVTAADVRAGWTRDGAGGELRPQVSRLVQSIVLTGDRALAIALRSRRVDVPMSLAHPDLAVAKPVAGSRWPLGTRSRRIAADAPAITIARDNAPAIRVLVNPGDPRDLLDSGVDLVMTRDAAALNYAATLPLFQSVPLAWQRTHILLTPGRARSSPVLSPDARQALAADAVRGEARGAQGPFWWEMVTDCELGPSSQPNQLAPIPRVVYDVSDSAARDLAERFVGLVRASTSAASAFLDVLLPDRPRRTFQRAAGLKGDELARARRLGRDAAYVVSVDSRPLDPCRDVQVLTEGARWLDPGTIVPLVDTRLQAIVRRGRIGVSTEWDGGVVIAAGGGISGPDKR
jgi:hypothetical protein